MTHSAPHNRDAAPEPAIDLGQYRANRSFAYLALRGAWACFRPAFWPGTPRRLSFLRILLLRLFGARIGSRSLVCGGVRVWEPWSLTMGRFSVLGDNVDVYNLAPISIGSNVVVSQRAFLCSASHDYKNTAFPLFAKPIIIHDNAWIAAQSYVGPGVTIGNGAVIGACSVVTRDMPDWMICAGNPCRPIKPRVLMSST